MIDRNSRAYRESVNYVDRLYPFMLQTWRDAPFVNRLCAEFVRGWIVAYEEHRNKSYGVAPAVVRGRDGNWTLR